MEKKPFIQIFKRLGFFLSLVLVLFLACLCLPYDRQYAYNQLLPNCDKGNWMYNRIFLDKTPIDIAFIGSSRTDSGVRDSLLEVYINKPGEKYLHVANFGFCRFGRTLDYIIIKDILKKHHPRLIVLETMEKETRYSHDDFPCIAEPKELLSVKLHPGYIKQLVKGIMFRLHYNFAIVDKFPPYDNDTGRTYNFKPHIIKDKEKLRIKLAKRHIKKKKETNVELEWRKRYSDHYIKKIADLAKENNIGLKILYLPGTCKESPDKPENYDFYKQLAPVLLPPSEIFMTVENCADVDHLTEPGANMLTGWLGEKLLPIK